MEFLQVITCSFGSRLSDIMGDTVSDSVTADNNMTGSASILQGAFQAITNMQLDVDDTLAGLEAMADVQQHSNTGGMSDRHREADMGTGVSVDQSSSSTPQPRQLGTLTAQNRHAACSASLDCKTVLAQAAQKKAAAVKRATDVSQVWSARPAGSCCKWCCLHELAILHDTAVHCCFVCSSALYVHQDKHKIDLLNLHTVQSLHADIDSFLLDLDTNFGIMELMDDADSAVVGGTPAAQHLQVQPRESLAGLDDAEIAREAAATSSAATRFKMAAEHAAHLAERAHTDMQTHRREALRAAECASCMLAACVVSDLAHVCTCMLASAQALQCPSFLFVATRTSLADVTHSGLVLCRSAASEESQAQMHRSNDDAPLAIACDAAVTRCRATHMRAARAYQSASETYREESQKSASSAAEARSRQQQADCLSAESLRREAAAAVVAATRALNTQRKVQQQLGHLHAHIAALQGRHKSAAAQAQQLLRQAEHHRSSGLTRQAEQCAQLAEEQRSRAAHIQAQIGTAQDQAEQLQEHFITSSARLKSAVAGAEQKGQLRREQESAALDKTRQEAVKAVSAARQRAAELAAQAEAVQADAAKLAKHIPQALQSSAASKGAQMIRARAAALTQDAEMLEQAAQQATSEADTLRQYQMRLEEQRAELVQASKHAPLLLAELRAELEGDDSHATSSARVSHADLQAAVDDSHAANAKAAAVTRARLGLLQQERKQRTNRAQEAADRAQTAKRKLVSAHERADQRGIAGATFSADAAVVEAQALCDASERDLACAQGAAAELDAQIAAAERQIAASTNRCKVLRALQQGLADAFAEAEAVQPAKRYSVNMAGAVSDLTIEIEHFQAELDAAATAQETALERAFEAVSSGDGALAAERVTEVRILAARRLELQESMAELQADLQRLQQQAPAGDAYARQEHELMLGESMDMLAQVASAALQCSTLQQQVTKLGGQLDKFQSKIAHGTLQAARLEGRAHHLRAQSARRRTDAETNVATELASSPSSGADEAMLAREAVYAATWQSTALRQQCDGSLAELTAAEKLLSKHVSAHEQMMSAVGVAITSATLRGKADKAADRVAALAAESQRRAEVARAAASEMRNRAAHLRTQGKLAQAQAAEEQCIELERDASHASDAAAAHEADAVQLNAQTSELAEQASQAEAQSEVAAEARARMQNLSTALDMLRARQDAAATASSTAGGAAADALERIVVAQGAHVRPEQLDRVASECETQGHDQSAGGVELAAAWHERADEPTQAARSAEQEVQHCGTAEQQPAVTAGEFESSADARQVRSAGADACSCCENT
jgi:hypothetical protein